MEVKNKRIILYITAAFVLMAVFGIVYAVLTTTDEKKNKFQVGTLNIEINNLDLKKNNVSTRVIMPGEIDVVSWTTENVGTITAKTRHVVDVYWKDVEDINAITEIAAQDLLILYPANLTDAEILADFENNGNKRLATEVTEQGVEPKWTVEAIPTVVQKQVNNKTVYGLRYKFLSATLDGSSSTNDPKVSSEDLSFKIFLRPDASYLYQTKEIGIDVVVEGLQENGQGDWTIADAEGI